MLATFDPMKVNVSFNNRQLRMFGESIYFVAETKGNLDSMELRGVEEAKIACAKKHFAAISNAQVCYDVVDSYQTLLQLAT